MNVALVIASSFAVLAAAVHGIAGERLVVRRLSVEALAPSPFGGPRMTMAMIHVTWHLTTFAFLIAGVGLLAAGSVLDGEAAQAVAVLAAAACTGFAAVILGLGAAGTGSVRSVFDHPGPAIVTLTAALAWWGAVTVA